MLKEFKEFALKGNRLDLAIGVVIGGTFQSIVNSLVNDIIMPLINVVTGKVDFSELVFTIGNSSIKYGSFISAIINFLIVAFSLFLIIRYINKINQKIEEAKKQEAMKRRLFKKVSPSKKEEEETETKEPATKLCPYCLTEIPYHATRCGHCTSKLKEEK